METKYDVLDGMKGMRKYGWMRPSLVSVPGLMDGALTFQVREPVSAKGSGSLSTMTKANGYVVVPENREGIPEGETVTVHLFGELEE